MHDAGGVGLIVTGMGATYRALGWAEIVAWLDGADMREVRPFWRREIMRLSGVLAAAMNKAQATEAEAPYQPD